MTNDVLNRSVSEWVIERPSRSRVFERLGNELGRCAQVLGNCRQRLTDAHPAPVTEQQQRDAHDARRHAGSG